MKFCPEPPIDDADIQARWDARIAARPKCACCGEHIATEQCCTTSDGNTYCDRCFVVSFTKYFDEEE